MKTKKNIFFLVTFIITIFTCNAQIKETEKTSSKSELIVRQSINAHGGDLYNTANYSFVFRGDTYQFKNDDKNFEYLKISKKGNSITKDILKNENFFRIKNQDTLKLNGNNIKRLTGAINSVIYFATLPHKLNDESVNKTYIGETTIKGKNYFILDVTFKQEGGGDDFEDQFHYWINQETKKVDYLAYSYKVNGGGVRFRSAYNTRVIDNVTFQDYINYKAELDTPLKDLPKLYEEGKLKELSKIKTENIINLKNK